MRRGLALFAVATLAAVALPQMAWSQGPVTVVEDFEGEFPGAHPIWGNGYSFHGGALADPAVVEEVISTGAGGSAQSYQISVDATNNIGEGSWGWYYGLGTFLGFYTENNGLAGGQAGEDNPSNYAISFDIKAAGLNTGPPIGGELILYKPDYEAVNGVDLNADGDMVDGFDTWVTTFALPTSPDNYADFNRVTVNLGTTTTPTAPAPIPTPVFDDESTFVLRLLFNAGNFGIDAGNVVNLDNVGITFTPAVSQPGDFDASGKVDGNDFVVWQRGGSPNGPLEGDLQTWRTNFGLPAAGGAVTAIPEPATLAGALFALAGAASFMRRRAA
ncbi:MAG TPA: PEP-CTERM sorting domain-containing protein [Lacipirellulaceae bacterium]|nr:PEP-CTERM sorting domain-containing protein [Lacipirellulaceae bacterium]